MVRLINIEDIKRYVDIPDSVEEQKLDAAIREAQEQYIIPILCRSVYDRLINGLEGTSVPTALETALVAQIKPSLCYRVFEVFLPGSDLVASRSGYKKTTPDNAESISADEKDLLIKQARRSANFYGSELRKWLDNNFSTDSDWKNCNSNKPSGLGQFSMSSVRKKKREFDLNRDI